jgi:chromate reductase, NAD(P)H dehydrogenase (quinone)
VLTAPTLHKRRPWDGYDALPNPFIEAREFDVSTSSRLLVVPGSARGGSLNKKLAGIAAGAARSVGAEVTSIDLRDYPMPVYDGDLEAAQGQPSQARDLAALFRDHAAILFVSPENNASVSSLLKNTIDWMSRLRDVDAFGGRVAALMAASPGALGGLRGLVHLRQILQTLNMLVITEQFALPRAHQAFDTDGRLADARQNEQMTKVVQRLIDVAGRLA